MKVFISYSRKDEIIANLLVYIFKLHDIQCYYDLLLPTGQSFNTQIEEMIKSSDIIIVLLTKSSSKSTWVNQEIGYALASKKRIWPIALEEEINTAVSASSEA